MLDDAVSQAWGIGPPGAGQDSHGDDENPNTPLTSLNMCHVNSSINSSGRSMNQSGLHAAIF